MSFTTFLRLLRWASRTSRQRYLPVPSKKRMPLHGGAVPCLEALEERSLLSGVSFSPPVSYGVGLRPSLVAVADVNSDGKLDLVTANSTSSSVSVLLGNGDGTFQAARDFHAGLEPTSVAAGDFNGDGKPDLVVANFDNTVSVLLGNGDGTFQAEQQYRAGDVAYAVAVGDFNGDGKLDLAVANASSARTVSVLLGNGDGTFQTAQSFAVGGIPIFVTVADFNGDGHLDLAVGNSNPLLNDSASAVSVLVGNGDGTFQAARSYLPGSYTQSVAVGDFNADGHPDLAVVGSAPGVLLGNGDGTFQAGPRLAILGGSVSVGDFNGDGKLDLVETGATNSVLLGNGDGTFQAGQNLSIFGGSVAVGDFNGDGKPDLCVTSVATNTVRVLLNALVTGTTVSGPGSSTYAQPVTYTANATSSAGPVTAGTVTFLDGSTPISSPLPLDANGQASFSIATLNAGAHTITASYSGTTGGAGITGFGPSTASASLVVNPLLLTAGAVNVSATAGAPFTGPVATFINPDPYGSAASYSATITWGDGSTSIGTIIGTGTLTVSGLHTYADPGSYSVSVQISHNLGNTTTATVSDSATVTTLGQGVKHGLTGDAGFWHNSSGQALINIFNGGSSATALSSWLATAFPNLYGINSVNNLTGATNAQVAAFYLSQFALASPTVEAQVMATALDVYATTLSLGGTAGQAFGFTVTATGLGADSFNVGADGAAFGVANKTTLNVYELLQAVNRQAVFGVLYNGDKTLRNEANDLFNTLNQAGSLS